MEIKVKELDGIKIMEVQGDIKFSNWQEMVTLANEIVSDGHKKLIVSWDNVGYMDSSAMGALISIHKLFSNLPEGKSVIFTSREEHHYVFQQAHFHTFLNIFDNLDKALASFSVDKDNINLLENGMTVNS